MDIFPEICLIRRKKTSTATNRTKGQRSDERNASGSIRFTLWDFSWFAFLRIGRWFKVVAITVTRDHPKQSSTQVVSCDVFPFLPCTPLSPILKSQRVPHGSGYTHVSSCDRRNLPRFPIPRRARHLYLLHAIYSGRYIKGDHATNSRLRRSHGLQGRYLYRRYDARRVHGGEALSDG